MSEGALWDWEAVGGRGTVGLDVGKEGVRPLVAALAAMAGEKLLGRKMLPNEDVVLMLLRSNALRLSLEALAVAVVSWADEAVPLEVMEMRLASSITPMDEAAPIDP